MVEKYITLTHLGEYSTASFYVEIVICKCAFLKNPQSIPHVVPCLVVEMTYAPHEFPLFQNRLSSIKFWYGVFINLAYSFLFSRLFYVCLLITYLFASKSNCHCRLWVTIQFILFHNSSFSECVDCFGILIASTD